MTLLTPSEYSLHLKKEGKDLGSRHGTSYRDGVQVSNSDVFALLPCLALYYHEKNKVVLSRRDMFPEIISMYRLDVFFFFFPTTA